MLLLRYSITVSFLPYLIGHRPCLERPCEPSKGQSFFAAAGNIAECLSRVKADILFSYQLPVNLVALCIMLPASYILSPRWFHKVNALSNASLYCLTDLLLQVNVFMIRYGSQAQWKLG